jgi:hypothetical protein
MMTRLQQLEVKRAESTFETTRANDKRIEARELCKRHISSATGGMVKIGPRECHAGDYQTQLRLWTEEFSNARERQRSLDAEVAREARKNLRTKARI